MDRLQPGNLVAQLYVAIQFDRIKRQFDFLYVAPIQKVLDLGIGQEHVWDAEADLRIGNIANLLLRLLPIPRFAFGKFTDQLAEQFERLDVVRFGAPIAVRAGGNAALAHHPLGIIVKGIIVPVCGLARLDGGFEFFGHAGALFPFALVAKRHRDQIMRMRFVILGLGNLQSVFEHLERNIIPPVAVMVIRLDLRRLGHPPNDLQIARAGRLDIARAGPPIERLLIKRPRCAVIIIVAARPVKIRQRLLHLRPDAVMIFDPGNITDEHFELMARVLELGSVRIFGGGLGTPLRISESELHPAFLLGRQIEPLGLLICLMRQREGAVGIKLLRVALQLFIFRGKSGYGMQNQRQDQDCNNTRYHMSFG